MSALKLNQVLAIEKGVKAAGETAVTKAYQALQRQAQWDGYSKTYQPRVDGDEPLPGEKVLVQLRADEVMAQVAAAQTRLIDVTATKDTGNMSAKADVVVDGVVLLSGVPVTTLIYLEKKLADLKQAILAKLPILDPSESWTRDENIKAWRSEPRETVRTKKVPRNHEKAPATDKHPAQVEVYYEDIPVGTWTHTKFSGAIGKDQFDELVVRVAKLSEAVKKAREEANSITVEDVHYGERIFEYLGW